MTDKMTKIIELRPDKCLTNNNFEKYQFSSEIVPTISKINLPQDVYRLEPTSSQESWLEARLFAFHNHLFKNPFDTSCWFVAKDWSVWRLDKNGALHQMHKLCHLKEHFLEAAYNPSIGFTQHKITVVSNGECELELLLGSDPLKIQHFKLKEAKPGVILNVQYVPPKCTVIIVMCAIVDENNKKCTQLRLLSYVWKDPKTASERFEFSKEQILKVRGTVDYVSIEENGEALHSISQDPISFNNPIAQIKENDSLTANEKSEIKIPKYCWSQDEDSLTVWVKLPDKHLKDDIKVIVSSTRLSINVNGNILVEGECQYRIEESLTTWKCVDDKLQIELFKFESGLMWNELIKGDIGGEHLPNENLAAEIHSRLAHLCTDQQDGPLEGQPCIGFNADQLEECDIEGRDNMLQRINLLKQETTHLATLGTSNHVLFTYKTTSGQAICLRHDHDACVWVTGFIDNNEWEIKHTHTYPGFGYVEASKSNKKFCVSPVDGSYVAIVEHTRHIFFYEKPEINVRVGKQWIVDLDSDMSPILGAVATNKYLVVLTKDTLYRLQILQ